MENHIEEKEILTFPDYYKSLRNERSEFIQKMVELTGFRYRTIMNYISGATIPDKPTRLRIAEYLKTDEKKLWPSRTI
ncbi:MAG: hypothetical protein CVU11_13975 [Bacteroidetes bacterium HGW-Bacteroidetes-6]|jgi:hypothetical protein|nr:MAG: hypothetical protein CVU11_13975 [Bacteroidetes bacterium HGW-Bacteroidetes-6]